MTLSFGDATLPTALDNVLAVNAARLGANLLSAVTIGATTTSQMWQALGYATLGGGQTVGARCELLFTIGTAAATGAS